METIYTYRVDPDNNTAMATIRDDDAPFISIANAPAVIEAADATLRFPITAELSPNSSIDVYYELVESTGSDVGDFIALSEEGVGKSKSVDFTNNATSSTLIIPINADDVPEADSTVTVTLELQPVALAMAEYNLASPNTPATTTISDDNLPEVAIETQFVRVSDTDYIEYTVNRDFGIILQTLMFL